MHDSPFMVQYEFRRLDEVSLFIPPGTEGIALFARDAVGHRKGQRLTYFFRFFSHIMASSDNSGIKLGKRINAFSVGI